MSVNEQIEEHYKELKLGGNIFLSCVFFLMGGFVGLLIKSIWL